MFLKNVLAVAVATNITFKEAEQAKAYAANPDAFKAAVVVTAPAAAPAKGKEAPKEEKKPEKAPEPEHESDDDMGFGLFD